MQKWKPLNGDQVYSRRMNSTWRTKGSQHVRDQIRTGFLTKTSFSRQKSIYTFNFRIYLIRIRDAWRQKGKQRTADRSADSEIWSVALVLLTALMLLLVETPPLLLKVTKIIKAGAGLDHVRDHPAVREKEKGNGCLN